MAALISIRDLGKTYQRGNQPVPVLLGIDLEIEAGDYVSLMGPSGSGKSTLLNLIAGIDKPTRGQLLIGGVDIAALPDSELADWRAGNVGFVFQFYNLIPSLTARENVALVTEIAKAPMRPEEALALVGLQDRLDHFPAQLSGGEQQRVAIARALVNQPQLILADEPTGALDTRTGDEIMALFKRLQSEGHTIILITHEQHIADFADRTLVMRDGELQEAA